MPAMSAGTAESGISGTSAQFTCMLQDAIPGGAPLRNAEPADSGGVPIQLGYPSKSMPTTVARPMLAGTAKTIAIPAPSVGTYLGCPICQSEGTA